MEQLINLLNNLHEENQQLKTKLNKLQEKDKKPNTTKKKKEDPNHEEYNKKINNDLYELITETIYTRFL